MRGNITSRYFRIQEIPSYLVSLFFSRITFYESCWIWNGARTKKGYGMAAYDNRRSIGAHALSYLIHFGPIPEGNVVCHDCPDGDNPACVNPAHLWLGTPEENTQDMIRKGRQARGERKRSAKLISSDVESIWKMRYYENLGTNQILERINHKVGERQIQSIITRKKWKHLNLHIILPIHALDGFAVPNGEI